MKELLSNEEIDALLDMFRSSGAPIAEDEGGMQEAATEVEESVVSPVDLLKPNRLSREHMRDLERLFQGSAKQLGAVMTDKLRFDMECDCVAVEQIRFNT